MTWRPDDWNVEYIISTEINKAIMGDSLSWEQLIEAGADFMLEEIKRRLWEKGIDPATFLEERER